MGGFAGISTTIAPRPPRRAVADRAGKAAGRRRAKLARVKPARSTRLLVLATTFALALARPAAARPSHGPIEPLAAGESLDGLRYLPLDVGRTSTFRDGAGNRYRQIVASPAPLLAADQKIRDRLRRRLVYEMPASGATRLIERRILEIDPARGVIAGPDEAQAPGAHPAKKPARGAKPTPEPERQLEMPARLAAGTTWTADGIEHRFQGVADVEVEAGAFRRCAVIDAKKARAQIEGAAIDMRSFYCPDVGEVAVLMMVNGTWRPAVELEQVTSTPSAGTTP